MFNKYKKILLTIILIILSFGLFLNNSQAKIVDIYWIVQWNTNIPCTAESCTIDSWISAAKSKIKDKWVITDNTTALEYVQKLISYLLTFLTLIATIYIIYAWFRILTSSWEDDVIKNSKKTIIYVIVWIALIWFAYEIAYWAVTMWDEIKKH